MKQLQAVLVLAASAAIVVGCGGGSSESSSSDPDAIPNAEVQLPATALSQMKALMDEKAARTPAQRKISSQLLYSRSGRVPVPLRLHDKGAPEEPESGTEIRSLLQVDSEGRVLCDVKGDVDAGLQRQIETVNGKVVASSLPHRSVRAWLHLESLETLAEQPIVQAIRPAFQAQTNRADPPNAGAKLSSGTREQRLARVQSSLQRTLLTSRARLNASGDVTRDGVATNVGAATSEGSAAHGADRARKFYNTNGTGVRIGVLSDSDDFKEASIASGDLPPDTLTVPGQDGRPGSGEGTAMMEIVHDVAPGAKLFFATAFTSPESFAENIRTLRFVYNCDIIVDDIIYYFESPYQDDIIAQAVNDVTADGALYFSSAGNQGNLNDGTSGTWEGDFKPAGKLVTLPPDYTVHDFDNGHRVISNRIELGGGPLILHWSDPGTLDNPQSSNDYDLFLLDQDLRNVVLASTDIQDGTGLPFESLFFFIPADFRVVVARNPGAQTRAIRIAHFGGEFGLDTEGSVYGHSAARDAFAVAAVDAAEAEGEFAAGPTTPVELFSSDGLRRMFYLPDGRRIGGGVTFLSGGGETRQKPEVTAADGVATTLPDFTFLNPFFGTSAAAPHAAAIAGLMKSAVPTADSFRLRQAMLDGALDIEGLNIDRDSGYGIVSAMNSLRQAGARPAVFLDLGTVTTTPTSSDAVIPGGGGQIAVQLVNNGGQTATNVRGTLSSSTPGVTITQALSNYPNLAAGASGSNLTPFAFTLSPTAMCGAKLAFSLSVTFNGRGTSPTVFGFPVQSGRVNPTATSFSYAGPPVAIPDDDLAGVDVPITVAGAGALARLTFSIDGAVCSADIGSTTVGLDHTWVGDLTFVLTSPSGTSVMLIDQAGGPLNSGNNFCQTVLQDGAASSIQNVASTQAPFTGTFSPLNPLGAFTGENADGTWTLNVSDNALFDTGSVRAVGVQASGFSCAP